jgi:hypothetical protein
VVTFLSLDPLLGVCKPACAHVCVEFVILSSAELYWIMLSYNELCWVLLSHTVCAIYVLE